MRKETDEDHSVSRAELCKLLNDMGISSNVRTLRLGIEVLTDNGFEIMSFLKDKEKPCNVPEHYEKRFRINCIYAGVEEKNAEKEKR